MRQIQQKIKNQTLFDSTKLKNLMFAVKNTLKCNFIAIQTLKRFL